MPYNPNIHHRRSIRLKGYDYSREGAYFITICLQDRKRLLGKIVNEEMILNQFGEIAYHQWNELSNRFNHIAIDVFQIMPNHIHGIIIIIEEEPVGAGFAPAPDTRATARVAPTNTNTTSNTTTKNPTIGDIVGAYKSIVSNECLRIYKSENRAMGKLFQRNYYERIIRDEQALNRIREYIINNPANWQNDKENK
jgi:REP element-mobilizing transposase RayT